MGYLLVMVHKKLSPDAESEIAAGYASGSSLESLAAMYGVAAGTVRNALLRMGVTRRPPGLKPNPILPTKTCTSCTRDLPRDDFYRSGIRTSECKRCVSQKSSDKYARDEQFRATKLDNAKRSHVGNPGRHTASDRLRRAGWSPARFDQAWVSQDGKCAICIVPMVRGGTKANSVCADHDHISGKPRALLCGKCNKHLGIYEKSHECFAKYLKTYDFRD
jgi:hypothetical protein